MFSYVVAEEDTTILGAADARATTPSGGCTAVAVQVLEVADALGALRYVVSHLTAVGFALDLGNTPWSDQNPS